MQSRLSMREIVRRSRKEVEAANVSLALPWCCLRAGGDVRKALHTTARRFQSTPPGGRRHDVQLDGEQHHPISIHASRREATITGHRHTTSIQDFNPRLHAGGDGKKPKRWALIRYFNPRLHAGGDRGRNTTAYPTHDFNPRLHAGGDILILEYRINGNISIHASTREATVPVRRRCCL